MTSNEERTALVFLLSTLVDAKVKFPAIYKRVKRDVLKLYRVTVHSTYENHVQTQ